MGLFNSLVRPSQTALGIGSQRHGIFQAVFPNMPRPDATSMFSNPAMIPHLPSQGPASPETPAPGPVIHKSAATRAAEAVAAHLAAYPKPTPKLYIKPTRENTPLAQSAGTRNTNFANSVLAAGGSNVKSPGDMFIQPTAENILFNNPLAPNVHETAQMRPTSGFLNVLFPR